MLSGIRILDLSRVLAGPVCTMMLGDLGADVIKVERPGAGDETRGWGPPFNQDGQSAYYLSTNRNKLSIAASLTDTHDRSLLERLIAGADVVVDNFRIGTLQRHGLDPDRFRAAQRQLIWCTITGFGEASDRPGYDFVVQAECGWMSITGEHDGDPMKVGVALADVLAGKDAAIAILGALIARGRSGAGRHIFTSLSASATAALMNVAQNVLVSGADAKRWGNAHPNLVPYQLFSAADRPIVIAVGSDAQWSALVRALGLQALADDPSLATNAGRLGARERVVEAIARRITERTASEWRAIFDAEGIPSGVVRTVLEALRDVHASALTGVAPSIPGTVRRPPPRLDEHGSLVRARGWGAFEE